METLPNGCDVFTVLFPPEFYFLTVMFDNFKQTEKIWSS